MADSAGYSSASRRMLTQSIVLYCIRPKNTCWPTTEGNTSAWVLTQHRLRPSACTIVDQQNHWVSEHSWRTGSRLELQTAKPAVTLAWHTYIHAANYKVTCTVATCVLNSSDNETSNLHIILNQQLVARRSYWCCQQRGLAIAQRQHNAPCQLQSCQLLHKCTKTEKACDSWMIIYRQSVLTTQSSTALIFTLKVF